MSIDSIDDEDLIFSDIRIEEAIEEIKSELDDIPPSIPIETSETITTCTFDCSSEVIINCLHCKRPFCLMHASRFSPNICKDCFKPMSFIINKVEHRVTDYDLLDERFLTKISKGTQITINLEDWVFYTAWIKDLTDEELKNAFEFHYFMVELIRSDNDTRKINKLKVLRGMSWPERKAAGRAAVIRTKVSTPKTGPDVRTMLKKMNPKLTDQQIESMVSIMMAAE